MSSETATGSMRVTLERPWDDTDLSAVFPAIAPDAHKYSRGVLTVFAGSKKYPGAAILASKAAQRMGAGYTEVITNGATRRLLLAAAPSLVVRKVGAFDRESLSAIEEGAKRAVCIGPGYDGEDGRVRELVIDVLGKAACPVLVDGGAISALASEASRQVLEMRAQRGYRTVLTPHVGEARRLACELGIPFGNLVEVAGDLSCATGAVIVLKSSDTFVARGRSVRPVYEGTVALAKAGSGDVLAGMIAALLAQGVGAGDAATLGVALHARAGKAAALDLTETCVTPEDLIDYMPAAIDDTIPRGNCIIR